MKIMLLVFLSIVQSVHALTLCPDGSYVPGSACEIAPDGSFTNGNTQLAPDGSYVSGTPVLTPDGTFVGEDD